MEWVEEEGTCKEYVAGFLGEEGIGGLMDEGWGKALLEVF
jgi:hypothetical protein